MPENKMYLPEGLRPRAPLTPALLRDAQEHSTILEAPVVRCDADRTLHVSLGPMEGLIPRSEAVSPWIGGADRDIALLSLVGKPVCFSVTSLSADGKGAPRALLSRRAVQERAITHFMETLEPGTVLTCRVTHMESFGAFLDIGCGVVAMLPIERISVSRIPHPAARFRTGQKILAAVLSVDRENRRFTMTHRELLGTWMENASYFSPGETVQGIVRSIRDYGAFVELAPNLSGLADLKDDVAEGDRVSVYIRSIRPEHMKIKLQIIQRLTPAIYPVPLRYQITDGTLDHWVYSPACYEKPPAATDFTALRP
ncbi:MAG: S1 RNA-binding domain-containing protein [Oscillibacter sp.]|nr:S1 RNA-binding domain-containing protein [Oscillibacter sp.]MEA4994063.1 S1 RNA-binding domain-containing protein [Oscillibacter sp.]